jgi:hypothetical protein
LGLAGFLPRAERYHARAFSRELLARGVGFAWLEPQISRLRRPLAQSASLEMPLLWVVCLYLEGELRGLG